MKRVIKIFSPPNPAKDVSIRIETNVRLVFFIPVFGSNLYYLFGSQNWVNSALMIHMEVQR